MKRKEHNLLLIAVTTLFVGALSTTTFGNAPGSPNATPPTQAGTLSNDASPMKTASFGVDDNNTSTIYPLRQVSQIAECPWINRSLGLPSFFNGTMGSNLFNTSTATTATNWTFNWASVAQEQAVEGGIKVLDYSPWVVSEPDKIKAGGNTFGVDKPLKNSNNNVNDVGGSTFNITYTPGNGAPNLVNANTSLHWIQALRANYDDYDSGAPGNQPYQIRLDNPYAKGATPFYDTGGAAGPTAGGGAYFLDTPWKIENEGKEIYEAAGLPTADVQFQVVLSADTVTTAIVGGKTVTTNAVTLYGGERWGYTAFAQDVPTVPDAPLGFIPPDIETAAVPLPGAAGVGFSMLGGFGILATMLKRVSRKPRIA